LLITAVLAPPLARGRAEQQVNKGSSQNSIIAGLREVEGPFNQINTIMVENGRVVSRSVALLPKEAFFYVRPKHELPVVTVAAQPQDKIHPVLRNKLNTGSVGDEKERIIISLRDTVRIPRFPEPADNEPRDSATNVAVRARAQELIEQIKGQRAVDYGRLGTELAVGHQARVLETFWIIKAMLVEMPLAAVQGVANREDVLYVEPENSGAPPPTVYDGRTRIASDQYFNLGQTFGFIGLLDTGVRVSHTQFISPDHIAFEFDCVNGGPYCSDTSYPGFNPDDNCWNHGTSSAGIITGNANLGDLYRGVTETTVDNLKVYPVSFNQMGECTGFLDEAAVLRAFQRVLSISDRVVVAEMQGIGSDTSAISIAADNTFDAGSSVIAANGNNGPGSGTVNTPANAHKVIGVGAFDVYSLVQYDVQSRGPAPDGRIKPDIQAPTNTTTASNVSSTALRVFGGTSGATPYAAGAAMLLRNWLRGENIFIEPGHVYAQLILSGQQPYPFNNTVGSGRLRLPDLRGQIWWGKVSISGGQTIDVPIDVNTSTRNILDGSLWWPESASQAHNDINLYLVDPSGVELASSTSDVSVFERARVSMSLTAGTWKLRIRAQSVPAGPQTVYWAALTAKNAWLGP